MTKEQGNKVFRGAIVIFAGRRCRVESIRLYGIAAPYFRLTDAFSGRAMAEGQPVGHQIVSWPHDCAKIVNK